MKEEGKLNTESAVSTNEEKARQEIVVWIHFPQSTSGLFVMMLYINSES